MSIRNKLIIFITIFLNLSSLVHAAPTKNIEKDADIQNAVLFYINEYRQKHGLSKLTMDKKIVIQAQKHSQDMANHRMPFGHQGFGKRIANLRRQIKNVGGGAENVAYNYKTAKIVVSGWIKSPGHRRNIVGNYHLTGIGVARDKQGRLYYTQIFLQKGKNAKAYAKRGPFIGVPFFGMQITH